MKVCKKEKMKIAYMCHKSDTMGGFPQHTEYSIKGLKDLGHDVDFFFLNYSSIDSRLNMEKKLELDRLGQYQNKGIKLKLTKGVGTGLYFDPEYGWITPTVPYKELEQKIELKNKLEKYDAVFWHTPFWFKQSSSLKDTDWVMLLDLKNPVNIAFIHDANLRSNGAWQLHISKYFDRIINVHHASYNSCSELDTPRTLIFNPQDLSDVDYNSSNFQNIKDTKFFFSLQNWKGSKHVSDFIRAIKYINEEAVIYVAGSGMERRYMHATDKCKDIYYCRKKEDPDCPEKYIGMRIIDSALSHNGFMDGGWLDNNQVDYFFKEAAYFVDSAWYLINKKLGSHFSRTLIESMKHGVVPIARNLGLSGNLEGDGELFVSGENYIMIPYDSTPLEFATIINESLNISEEEYNRIVQNNYDLLPLFDINYVCKQYEQVIRGEDTGFFNKYEVGSPTKKIIEIADKQWYGTGTKRTFNFKKDGK